MSFKIKGTNRLLLMTKYKNMGWSYDRINEHFSYLDSYFESEAVKLRKKKMPEEDINQKLLEDLARLISQ